MHDDTYEKRTCLFVELDPFSSYHPHNLDKTSLLCRQLKLACIFFDIVDINTDVFSHNPIALSVLQELAPLVRSGLLWPSTGIKETPTEFIRRKLIDYAKQSIESDKIIYEIEKKWEYISPEKFRIFRRSITPQINAALSNIENSFAHHKNKRYFSHIQHHLESQKSENRFNREDLLTTLAFTQKSFPNDNIKDLAQFVSAEYIYQGTQNKQLTYTIFPGATGLKLIQIHPEIAKLGYNKKHILKFNKVLIAQNIPIKKLLNIPTIELCRLLHDDAFIFLRQHYIWPDIKEPQSFIINRHTINQNTNIEKIKLTRTIKSSYALPLLKNPAENKKGQPNSCIFIINTQPLLYLQNKIKITLSIEEHQILKLIAYNTDGICHINEALQHLAISKKLNTGKENFFIDKESIINLRNYLDAKLLSPLNKKLAPHSIKICSKMGVVEIHGQDKKLQPIVISMETDTKQLSIIKEYAYQLRESQAKKLLTNIDLFVTPIHVSFLFNLLNTTDEILVSKSIYKLNQILDKFNLALTQPGRSYYHLTLMESAKTSKMPK